MLLLFYFGFDLWYEDSFGGVIFGVGGDIFVLILKFDDLGCEIGFYGVEDV